MSKPLICVFAGAHTPKDETIRELAKVLGTAIGEEGFDILYGGGSQGLMGDVTNAANEAGADVKAVLLNRFAGDKEKAPGAEVISIVETEYERFQLFDDPSKSGKDIPRPVAYFALPGATGTFRETGQGIENAVYNEGPPVFLVHTPVTDPFVQGIKSSFNFSVEQGLMKEEALNRALKVWTPGEQSLREALGMPKRKSPAKVRHFSPQGRIAI